MKKIKFAPPKGCNCRTFMKELLPQVNAWRRAFGLRPMSMGTFYRVRLRAVQGWLDLRAEQYPNDASKWVGNPFLPTSRNGGYVFSKKNANYILAVAVAYDLKKPRGLPAVRAKRAKQQRRRSLARAA